MTQIRAQIRELSVRVQLFLPLNSSGSFLVRSHPSAYKKGSGKLSVRTSMLYAQHLLTIV